MDALRTGDKGPLTAALKAGQITAKEAVDLLKSTPLVNDFEKLNINQALDVWDQAIDAERKQLRPLLVEKYARARVNTPRDEWQGIQERYGKAMKAGN